jgi:hypothetical protein
MTAHPPPTYDDGLELVGRPPVFPPPDFPVYGFDESWAGPRWLEFLQGQPGRPLREIWLAHGWSPSPEASRPWARVGTFPAERYVRLMSGRYGDAARTVATAAVFDLMNRTSPVLPEQQRRRYWEAAMQVEAQAEDYVRWPTANWRVDGRSVQARIAWWAGAWTGFTMDVSGVAIVVVAHGIAPGAVQLARVDDARPYGFDLDQPLAYPEALHKAAAAALGVISLDAPAAGWPMHADHERLLQL